MRDIDRLFLKIFKDLKITPNKAYAGTEEKPNYVCYIGKNSITHAEVVRMVKQYQDEVVKMLLEESQES